MLSQLVFSQCYSTNLINFTGHCQSAGLIPIWKCIFIRNNSTHNRIPLLVAKMSFACRSRTPVGLGYFFRIRICKIDLALISLMIHLGTMTYWPMVLSIELLKRFHLAKVKIITFFVEAV